MYDRLDNVPHPCGPNVKTPFLQRRESAPSERAALEPSRRENTPRQGDIIAHWKTFLSVAQSTSLPIQKLHPTA